MNATQVIVFVVSRMQRFCNPPDRISKSVRHSRLILSVKEVPEPSGRYLIAGSGQVALSALPCSALDFD
jgi:hypothetical protein